MARVRTAAFVVLAASASFNLACGGAAGQKESPMPIHSGFAEVNGTRLYYETAGNGFPLVLIHGGLMDRRMWDGQIEPFSRDYRVIRYDVRGYDRSDKPREPFSHVEDLHQLLKFLKVDKAHILGLSMGGQIAIDFALEHPGMTASLIPAASAMTGFPYKDAEGLESQYEAVFAAAREGNMDRAVELTLRLPFFVPVKSDPALPEKMKTMIRTNFMNWASSQARHAQWPEPPAYERISRLRTPTLILVGDHDVSDIQAVADKLAASVPGAKKVVIRDAGHHLNMENPAAFNSAVLEFLKACR